VTAGEVEQVYRAEYAQWKERHDAAVAKYKEHCAKEHDEVVGLGGLHSSAPSARIPPHRQPAPGPLRPPGRPGLVKFYLSLEDT